MASVFCVRSHSVGLTVFYSALYSPDPFPLPFPFTCWPQFRVIVNLLQRFSTLHPTLLSVILCCRHRNDPIIKLASSNRPIEVAPPSDIRFLLPVSFNCTRSTGRMINIALADESAIMAGVWKRKFEKLITEMMRNKVNIYRTLLGRVGRTLIYEWFKGKLTS